MAEASERCTRCGGRLYAMWRHPVTGSALPLCTSHNVEHRAALMRKGWRVRLFSQV